MEKETQTPDARERALDPAAQAFDELRGEVTMMRITMQQLVAVPMNIDIPNYTDTLALIRAENKALAAQYKELRHAPALALAPDQLGKQIAAAGASARQAEQAALSKATSDNGVLSRELSRYLEQAKTAHEQWKWLLWTGGLSFVAGVLLTASIWSMQNERRLGAPSSTSEQNRSK
jgi:hypothetical protein